MLKIVGHRAYKGKYPENTIEAYENAFASGVDIIETDLQMTKDGVVVVNHDSDTGRMWDKELIISESTYEELQELRCKENPDLKMLTLDQVLEWAVAHPSAKMMLDIKFTNKKIILMKCYSAMMAIKNDRKYWQNRIIWGVWLLDWFKYGVETGVFQDFKVIVITLSLDIAKDFIEYSLQLNNAHYRLYGISIHFVASWTYEYTTNIVPMMKRQNVKVFLWTVNKAVDIKYACQLPSVYAIITDDPVEARHLSAEYVRHHEDIKKFEIPSLISANGIRFHSFVKVYNIVAKILFAKWLHFKVFGWSIAYVIFLFLRSIKFLG
ncbi:hypothetical protein Kpol_1002p51 [Vanderwaltozyma polyspora DSM 70294]|uniref:GP-PDE domain-containing protein n=1 Tax=Vanderwaltozyma polyspora (strain ATCC 22028 / DSM 70294 / BCRC 21397 / CBS 2163 / NBRC 10782 / NRRL Y-8283 / UCD 57-17) TaxID=436907 RepID=A7TE82_VANPO|nr:uncharacterized protein Kpol_1002p51 [Vanderwaltozyma polyspora DSM 70294]EDO19404.1 hypothetical protein Kpol_1002p51 [Vanderwaltozyma polyspora DSM 70294]